MSSFHRICILAVLIMILLGGCSGEAQELSSESMNNSTTQTDPNPIATMAEMTEQTSIHPSAAIVTEQQPADEPTIKTPDSNLTTVQKSIELDNLDDGLPKFITFVTDDCLSCQSMDPVIRELQNLYSGEVVFYRLDGNEAGTRQIRQLFAYRYPPHYLLLDGEGEIIEQWHGVVGLDVFQSAFANVLSSKE